MKKATFMLLNLFLAVTLFAQTDKSGCADHPLINRFPGAVIEYCDIKNHSEYAIATGPETGYRTIEKWVNVSGKQTRIYYSLKGDKIVSEVYQNYLTALKNSEFNLLANKMHQERNISKEVGGNSWLGSLYRANPFPTNAGIKINMGSGTMGGTFYIAGSKQNVYIVISGKRYSDNETVVLLDILETQEMEDNLIKINADFIADKLFKEGKVALNGILFDFNKATIKDESKPLVDEIAKFLKANPTVIIFVVGHTDMTGEVQYNIDLSDRRAKAVKEYLITQHQIAEGRLLPYGVGPLAPADNNTTESGKEKNRRVELVLKSK
ncbi:MAG: OmpA family protein [Bacteroidetes bacterium]|nr:OmpA family protein [Bacteroidota bacterium]MBK8414689.1 OmpA family protein [Bacteroidota bacterium]MBK9047174.1 OmpA family protein [Bacteroidota bacterium]MBK9422846.1 OmpA family protein [Bacteroidota bacterium]MBL0073235.1 OmpA family protein [Bacteroidota bacterium]